MIRSAVSANMTKNIKDKEIGLDLECDTKMYIKSEPDKDTANSEAVFKTNQAKAQEIQLGIHTELEIKYEHMEMSDNSNSCWTENINNATVDADINKDTENNVSNIENNSLIQSGLDIEKKRVHASYDNTNHDTYWETNLEEFRTEHKQVNMTTTDKIETETILIDINKELKSSVLNTDTRNSIISNAKRTLNECDTCSKQFKLKSNLIRHLEKHSGERPYECKICKKQFPRKWNLTSHLRTHSGERPYQCEICKMQFTHKTSLIPHLRIHSGERPYECEMCNIQFGRKFTLTLHLQTHSGERPYKCATCKKQFTRKLSLTRHLRIHSGERPYECKICKKQFPRKWNLTSHLRTHSGERPYQCEICKMQFTHKTSLISHLRKHSGEKPYECEMCNKHFRQKSTLNLHLRAHSGERP